MKVFKAEEFEVVKAGRDFVTAEPFDMQALASRMEKNESYIFWMQRPEAGISSQVAAVKINGTLYNPNMKLEKAIFRHIRLTKNFCNMEVLPDGTKKLRLPVRLFNEKLRTSNRFEVRAGLSAHAARPHAKSASARGPPIQDAHTPPRARDCECQRANYLNTHTRR